MNNVQAFGLCLVLTLAAGQSNYDSNRNYNNPYNNQDYNSSYSNYNPNNYNNNYPTNSPNYSSNPYNTNNPNFDRNNPNYNPNNYDPNNPNYNRYDPNNRYDQNNRNDPNNPNNRYDPNNPNRYDPNNSYNRYDSTNSNNRYDPNNPNSRYDPNNPNNRYDPNNPNTRYDPNNPNSRFDPNNPNARYDPNNPNSRFDPNNPNGRYDPNNPTNNNPGFSNRNQNFNSQPLDNTDCCEEYCYTADPEPYLFFGTKTAYESLSRRNGNQHVIPDCKPIQFWSLLRHGTRLPDSQTIRNMRNMNKIHDDISRNYEQRRSYPDRGRLCPNDYDLFRRWRFNESINEGMANILSRQGVEDMKLLARRYKAKYPELLQDYDERFYYFQYSQEDRTHDSFQAYIEGLFDQDAYKVHANTVNGQKLTNPFQNCPKWQEEQNVMFVQRSEADRFRDRSEYQKLIKEVFRRLGFRFTLNPSVIEDMYDLCRYEKAWNPQPRSPWCIAFNKDQLKIMEYVEDVKHYYKSGYGNRVSEKMGCSPIKDMYEKFEKKINGYDDGLKASFIFGETETFLSALTALRVAKDYTPLTAENYNQQSRREWKTSTLSPFAANLVATLYECSRGEKHRVMFFLNEVPVEFPDCSVGLCNWSTMQQKYQSLINSCNIDQYCYGRATATRNYAALAMLVLSTVLSLKL